MALHSYAKPYAIRTHEGLSFLYSLFICFVPASLSACSKIISLQFYLTRTRACCLRAVTVGILHFREASSHQLVGGSPEGRDDREQIEKSWSVVTRCHYTPASYECLSFTCVLDSEVPREGRHLVGRKALFFSLSSVMKMRTIVDPGRGNVFKNTVIVHACTPVPP